jgi:WD40 repeat protein
VAAEPGALPLLEHALLELWERRRGDMLTLEGYRQAGGVHRALAQRADTIFEDLTPDQQEIARRTLLRLTQPGEGSEDTRRRATRSELSPVDGDHGFDEVLGRLVDARLLTTGRDETGQEVVDVSHEALIRGWPRLRAWVDADRAGLLVHRRLIATAHEWETLKREPGALYRGGRLVAALEWASGHPEDLSELERVFLTASRAAEHSERARQRRWMGLALGGFAAAIIISTLALIAVLQRREANRQRDISASRALAVPALTEPGIDPALSLELALRALERRETVQAENALREATYAARAIDVWPTHREVARALSVSKDGLTVATAGDDGTIAVRRMDSGRLLSRIKLSNAAVIGVALSPDGRRVASTRDNGSVTISAIDGRDPRTVLRLRQETTPHYGPNYGLSVSFSNDGRRLVVGALDGTVRVLRADGVGAVRVLRGHQDLVLDVGFSPDGSRVVSSDYRLSARAWDLRSGTPVRLRHKDVESASFSPAGDRIATAGLDGIVRLWRADGSGPTQRIRIGVPLLSVRFRPNGRRLVTAGQDGVVRISDVHGGPVLGALMRHRGQATGAAFVAHGQVVSTGEDGTLRRWAPLDAAILRGSFVSASFSPDGSHVLTGGNDGRARLFDPKTGAAVAIIGPDTAATTARYSADGRRVVTASLDGAVRIADPRSGRSRVVVKPDRAAAKTAADLDPSGQRIVSGGYNAKAVIQAVSGRGKPVELKGHRAGLTDVRFSRDGHHVLTASGDGTARIWNAATGRVERMLKGHGETVSTAQYSADGKRIVTAGADGTVRVWPARGRGPAVILRGHEGAVHAAAFSPDGTRVVSAGLDGTIRVWAADGGETLVVLYRHQGGARSASFSPDGKAVVSSGEGGIARVSPCEVCGSLREVRRLARTRATRALSPIERQRFLLDTK